MPAVGAIFPQFYRHKSAVGIASINSFKATISVGKAGERPAFFSREKVLPELHSRTKDFVMNLFCLSNQFLDPQMTGASDSTTNLMVSSTVNLTGSCLRE